ncbi:DUF4357 domain-containing protein [Rhizobium oryziradicis]|uniref:DUF4357 domain-containing protein n=1 Tax=Rhizobium oryziradicis TaxID=1867956 RepID=UPI00158823FA|nr:DUF4357 domain-containing protein [Rhizobium oryziradicis]
MATIVRATAVLVDGEFFVQAGSKARKSWFGDRSPKTHYWRLFDELVANGVLEDCGEFRRFKDDYKFSSTSAAGSIVTGRSTPGPTAWKLQNSDKTYRDWEIEMLA